MRDCREDLISSLFLEDVPEQRLARGSAGTALVPASPRLLTCTGDNNIYLSHQGCIPPRTLLQPLLPVSRPHSRPPQAQRPHSPGPSGALCVGSAGCLWPPPSPSPFHTPMLSPWLTLLTPCCSTQGAVCVPSPLPVPVHGTPAQPAPSACWIIGFLPFIQCRMPCLQLPANPCCCPQPTAELSPQQSSWQTQFACPPVLHPHPSRSSSHL